jgi:hypothetical protein
LRIAIAALLLFFSVSPGLCDYRKGLELYQREDYAGAIGEFRRAAESKQFDGYQEVVRDMYAGGSQNVEARMWFGRSMPSS